MGAREKSDTFVDRRRSPGGVGSQQRQGGKVPTGESPDGVRIFCRQKMFDRSDRMRNGGERERGRDRS